MTGLLLILLSWLVGISPQTALAQAQAREADKEKIFQQLTLEKTLELQYYTAGLQMAHWADMSWTKPT